MRPRLISHRSITCFHLISLHFPRGMLAYFNTTMTSRMTIDYKWRINLHGNNLSGTIHRWNTQRARQTFSRHHHSRRLTVCWLSIYRHDVIEPRAYIVIMRPSSVLQHDGLIDSPKTTCRLLPAEILANIGRR